MAFDVALRLEGSGEDIKDILERHNLKTADLQTLKRDKIFLQQVKGYREDIREKGLTFRVKARTQAEELLKTSWLLIHDPGVSPSVKADLIKSTVKWGGLEVKADDTSAPSGGVRITINLGDGTTNAAKIIDDHS